MTVTTEEREQIRSRGFAYFGGVPKKRYWTPDGREIINVPAMRTFNIVKEGRVISSGIRDANLDNGWLEQKPEVLKLYCPYCDKWHDTQEEVDGCGKRKGKFNKHWEKKAREELKQGMPSNSEIDEINDKIAHLTKLVELLLEKK